ncbi:MAG: MOSC domain-containing protein [Thermaurantiacus sp.]
MEARLLDIRTGQPRPLGRDMSAYAKDSRSGPVQVDPLGLEGDAVADTRVHGGPDKAVYCYAAANYLLWRAEHPEHAASLVPGAFGENLLLDGIDEESVCIGDRWRAGSALIEPCQPRQPCHKLASWFGDARMVKAMTRNGRSGWYARVIEPGTIEAGGILRLEHRPDGAWSIARVLATSYRKPASAEELRALAIAPGLAGSWADWARRQAEVARTAPAKV